MALVKLVRDTPEVPNGALEMETPEENVRECITNGWRLAETKSAKKEEVKAEKVDKPVEEKTETKVETPKKTKKTL